MKRRRPTNIPTFFIFRMRGVEYSTFTRSRSVRRTQVPRRTNHNMVNSRGWQPVEEQTLPAYHQKRYCPVRPSDLFKNRYRIIAKLGYGAYSTVWLAQDERLTNLASYKPQLISM
jgi:hypothetical protein